MTPTHGVADAPMAHDPAGAAARDDDQALLRIALRATGAAVWSIDFTRGGAETFDARGRELLGLPDAPSHCPAGTLYRYLHPDDRAAMEAAFRACVEGRAEPVEYRVVRADGTVRWLQGTGEAERDAVTGRVTRFVGISFDVTERRAARAALEEADRQKDRFLALVGHELRTPLATIGYAVRALGAGHVDAGGHAIVEQVERQLAHMARLLDDLADAARVREGKLALDRREHDLAALVVNAADGMRARARSRGVVLAVETPVRPARARVDAVRLTQVVTNLVSNAVRHTDPGGRVCVTLESDGAEASLRVADDGVGLAPADLTRIFEPFVQLEPESRIAQGSLGIGLALVKHIVALHGGTVEAASEGPGRGSVFTVRLPLAASA